MKRLLAWFESRLQLASVIMPMLRHPIPKGSAGPLGWWYVFGSATLTLLAIQILTGICLSLVYVPTADRAYDSLLYLNYEYPLGWFLRAVHFWAGSGMVLMAMVHMTQVFLHGAYKYPRELTWLVGVFLLLLTLGMAFSGQVLRWDPDAYWGLAVGAAMAGRVPIIGPGLVDLLLGGPTIGGNTLSRFFTLHVFVMTGLLLLLVGVHLWLVLKKGVSEPPIPGVPVDPKTYDARYEKELENGEPFFGDAIRKDIFFSALTTLAVVLVAALVGPKDPTGPPNPVLLAGVNPRPDWPFLWLFALLSLSPPDLETPIILILPLLLVAGLLLVPIVSNRGERAPSRRPVAVLTVVVIYTFLILLSYLGKTSPWSPVMEAWSRDPIPEPIVEKSSPMQLQGGADLPVQELPELPCARRRGRQARSRPERSRRPADPGPADRPDQQRHAGRRQHAGLRQTGPAARDGGPDRFPGLAASPGPACGQADRHRGALAMKESSGPITLEMMRQHLSCAVVCDALDALGFRRQAPACRSGP